MLDEFGNSIIESIIDFNSSVCTLESEHALHNLKSVVDDSILLIALLIVLSNFNESESAK